MGLMNHALAVAGFIKADPRKPKPGCTIVKVECMATIRNEIDTGYIVEYSEQKHGQPIEGLYVQWDKAGFQFEPLDHLRLVNDAAEIWS